MRILVLGAAGHTGRFVVDDLVGRGLRVTAAGRYRGTDRLATARATVPYESVTLPDPGRLAELLAAADVVVNCAGPFADTALDVVRAATRAGVAYLDVNAEQAVTRSIFEAFRDEPPAALVVPSVAFFGALGDLVATAAAGDWSSVESAEIVIGLDSWHPTNGTRKTGARNSGRRLTFADGRLQPATDPRPAGSWDFGEPLGVLDVVETSTADQVTVSSHLATTAVRVRMNARPLADLSDPDTPAPALGPHGRSAQLFTVAATVTRDGQQRSFAVSGHDIYAITAPIVGQAVELLAGHPRAGVHALAGLVDAEAFLRRLAPYGVQVRSPLATAGTRSATCHRPQQGRP